MTAFAPFRAVLDDPIRQGPLKTDIAPLFLRLNPLVPEDLFAFRLTLSIQRRVLQQIIHRELVFRFVRHKRQLKLTWRYTAIDGLFGNYNFNLLLR